MNELDIKELKEAIGQVIDIMLNDDIKKGRNLLQLCEKYEIINKSNHRYICEIQGHMQQVRNFIYQIISKYSNLINFYNILNGYNSNNNNNNNQIDCRTIKSYVDFLETVKMLKNEINKVSSYNDVLNVIDIKKYSNDQFKRVIEM